MTGPVVDQGRRLASRVGLSLEAEFGSNLLH